MTGPVLSVVIVNYNTRDLLEACLASIYRNQGGSFEVIVVDNNSSDGSIGMVQRQFKAVTIIGSSENLGFARGCNQGIRAAGGRHILLLNSDTEVFPDTFEKLQRLLDDIPADSHIGIIGCRILNPDKTLQYSAGKFPTIWSTVADMFRPGHKRKYCLTGYDEPHEADWVTGAFMVISRNVINDAGLFDERYFMYYEEVDYCLNAKKKGWKVLYSPAVFIIHKNPHASKQNEAGEKVLTEIRRSHLYYYRKNHTSLSFLILSFATFSLLLLKYCVLRAEVLLGKSDLRGQQEKVGQIIPAVWKTFWELCRE